MRSSTIVVVLTASLALTGCQVIEKLKSIQHAPGSAKKAAKVVVEATGSDGTPGGAASVTTDDALLEVVPADEAHGWSFEQVVAGEYAAPGPMAKQPDGRPRLLVDPDCPTAFAVVGMQGSRWKVTFRGDSWSGFDRVHSTTLHQPGLGGGAWAISPDGQHLGFLASRGGEFFYVVDGVEGPAAGPNQHGPIVFSDDSRSYAYTLGKSGLVVDGEVLHADGADGCDTLGGLGFARGTHDLHYYRLRSPRVTAGEVGYTIVSGARRFEGVTRAGFVEPVFLPDGTPYWYELGSGDTRTAELLLVMDGEPVPGVGRLTDPNSSNTAQARSAELLAQIVGEGADRPLEGFYVIKDGQARWYDIPADVDARRIQPASVQVAPDLSRLAYRLDAQLVVGDTVSLSYERILDYGFTASGRCVATAMQGGKVFLLVDGVEQEQGYAMNSSAELFTSVRHDRVTVHGGGKAFVGTVGSDGLVLEEQDLEGWAVPRLEPSADGSTLLGMSSRYEQGSKGLAVMRDHERIAVEGVSAVRDFQASPDGSQVLWEGRVLSAKRAREAVFLEERLLGRVMSFGDASFGDDGHYAFSALRHPAVGQLAKDAAKQPRVLCVDGTFFEGLRPLERGTWVDGAFHVLCARGEGDDAEVLMAIHRS